MNDLSPYIPQPHLLPALSSSDGQDTSVRQGTGLDLRSMWQILRRRQGQILLCFLVVVLTVVLGSFLITPIYTAETTLLIQQKNPQIINVQQVLADPFSVDNHDYFETQYAILRSRSLAKQVIREL